MDTRQWMVGWIGLAMLAVPMLAVSQAADVPPVMVKAKAKPDKKWQEYPTRTIEQLPGFQAASNAANLDEYGGRVDHKEKVTGFFHAAKVGGRWWLVDPKGGLFLDAAVDDVAPGKSEESSRAFASQFTSPQDWATKTTRLLFDNGFNGTGAWSDVTLLRATAPHAAPRRVVYTQIWNFMAGFARSKELTHVAAGHPGYVDNCIPVFHPDFPAWCEKHAESLAATRDDPYLLGHFLDNEMPKPDLRKYLELNPAVTEMASSRAAAHAWFIARKGSNASLKDITPEDQAAWIEFVMDRYYNVINPAIRKYDPNHLCLGTRYHTPDKHSEAQFRAAGRHCDVISFNYYNEWGPDEALLQQWAQWSGKPCMITEFYVKGDDAGFANTTGAGWIVPTQHDRGLYYQHFVLRLIESKACVGWHWFKYMDNDPNATGTDPSNRDSNKGIVNIKYQPYQALLSEMKPLNQNMYRLADYFDQQRRPK